MCSHPQTTSLSHVDEVCQPLWGRPKPPVSPAMDAGGTSPPWDPGKLMCSELWSFAFEDGSLGDWREEWSGHRVAGTGPIRAPQEHSLRLGEGLQAERGGRASHRGFVSQKESSHFTLSVMGVRRRYKCITSTKVYCQTPSKVKVCGRPFQDPSPQAPSLGRMTGPSECSSLNWASLGTAVQEP